MYQETLEAKKVPPRLRTRIKNVVEAQRSALEYLAHQLHQGLGTQKGRNSYFPIVNDPDDFLEDFDRLLPGVAKKAPGVRTVIRSRQPFQPGYAWLDHLAMLTNENKHRKLSPQTKTETRLTETTSPGGGRLDYTDGVTFHPSGGGISFGPGGSISFGPGGSIELGPQGTSLGGVPVDPVTQRPIPVPGGRVQRTIYVDWLFADPARPALETLEEIQDGLPEVVDAVCAAAARASKR